MLVPPFFVCKFSSPPLLFKYLTDHGTFPLRNIRGCNINNSSWEAADATRGRRESGLLLTLVFLSVVVVVD